MKKLLCLLAFALMPVPDFAQEIPFQMQKSAVFKDEYKFSNILLVEDDGNGGVVIVRSYRSGNYAKDKGYYFEHYDEDMALIKEYEYELKNSDTEKGNVILGLIMHKNQVNIIDYAYNKSEKAYVCSAISSSINDFQFTKKELFRIASDQIKKTAFFSLRSFDNDSGASMIVNEDKTAFAITVDIKNNAAETHKLFLFDSALNKTIDHTFIRDIKDRDFKYENIDVSKDGLTLYLLGKAYAKENKKKSEGGKYQYELTRITKDSEKTQIFDTKEHFAASLKTIVFENKLVCVGFYSDRKDYRYKGISYFELDPATLDIKKSKYNPFTDQFIIDKYGKNKDKELKSLSFRKILITGNNDIVFNAEEYYVTTIQNFNPNGINTTTTIFHYDDIVSAKLNQEGDIVWARNINKRQATTGDESYISYTSTAKGNDTYFFINTGEKVKKLRNDRIQFGQTSTKKSNLNVIRIKANGDFDYQEILDDKDNEVPFMVSDGAIFSNSVLFIGRKGKKKQLLKITL